MEFYRNRRGEWAVAVPCGASESEPGISPRLVVLGGTVRLERGGGADAESSISRRVTALLSAGNVASVTVVEFDGDRIVRWYPAEVSLRRVPLRRSGQGGRGFP